MLPSEVDRDLSSADAERLCRLWPSGSAPEVTAWEPGDLTEILRLQLATLVERPSAPVPFASFDGTYRDLFFHPAPPAILLLWVKDWAKPMMSRDGGELPREVAGVLYFAAVAAARLRGIEGVSQLPDITLQRGAAWALKQPWLDADVSQLFRSVLAPS